MNRNVLRRCSIEHATTKPNTVRDFAEDFEILCLTLRESIEDRPAQLQSHSGTDNVTETGKWAWWDEKFIDIEAQYHAYAIAKRMFFYS